MLDDIGYPRGHIGFPFLSLVLVLGSVWAYRAWGSYWSWDPRRQPRSSRGSSTACTCTPDHSVAGAVTGARSILLFGFAAVMFTYYGNYFFGGLHAYGGV